MSDELLVALISLVSGSGVTALVKIYIDHLKAKQEDYRGSINERIRIWQEMSEKHEARIEILERKLESYERDFRSLERYILSLEQFVLRVDPHSELPKRPKLEREGAMGS